VYQHGNRPLPIFEFGVVSMFYYYGSKSKIAKYYPKPKYDTIVEPFAGSAAYSLLYRNKRVILNEKDRIIYDIWNWLINSPSSCGDIFEHMDLYENQDIRELNISEPHRNFLGFLINRGSVQPCNIVQKWSCQVPSRPGYASTVNFALKRALKILPEIRHWEIKFGDYSQLENAEATWFIDPPYSSSGFRYKTNDVDYNILSDFCSNRNGQIIVCEQNGSDWLDFQPFMNVYGQLDDCKEMIWTNSK
jgi:site-specific DNA-adenine methylase